MAALRLVGNIHKRRPDFSGRLCRLKYQKKLLNIKESTLRCNFSIIL